MIYLTKYLDSQWTVDTFSPLNKMLSVDLIATVRGLIWRYGLAKTHISHKTHLQQSSNIAQCGNECWLWAFEMYAARQTITPPQIPSPESEIPLIEGGVTHHLLKGYKDRSRWGQKQLLPQCSPCRPLHSRVCWIVRPDGSQEKMGGNVWCPTMPISSGRRFKGWGVEVRNHLGNRKMNSISPIDCLSWTKLK